LKIFRLLSTERVSLYFILWRQCCMHIHYLFPLYWYLGISKMKQFYSIKEMLTLYRFVLGTCNVPYQELNFNQFLITDFPFVCWGWGKLEEWVVLHQSGLLVIITTFTCGFYGQVIISVLAHPSPISLLVTKKLIN
jgi:hypothetical protein